MLLASLLVSTFAMQKASINPPAISQKIKADCDRFVQQHMKQRQTEMARGIPSISAYTPEQKVRDAAAEKARKEFAHGPAEHNQTHGHDTGFAHHAHGYTPAVVRR